MFVWLLLRDLSVGMTYGVVVLLQQTTLSNTDTGEYEPGRGPAQIGTFLVVNGT